ncbi:M23 family metallopeptidase [Psychrobium sp. 1_MG-2023]|uniref:M23 family metallopeptidase n=1 Tax=Psychrobium sp. 1_MG-2023 TaxID=3062624 RepID=UPI000C31C45B|nr:M23 family metallopeptidase [Psychrobium sp. 1_MG-2023]MDP2561721.1 M23 family metallopeptidase [Psychrobium sp. 1_MG-2023]PKF57137.1 peptidase [Alteromonadales bacterium alter-6D02]
MKKITFSLLLLFVCPALLAQQIHQLSDTVSLKGTFTQGALLIGQAKASDSVFLNDKPVAIADDGLFVIGFGRDAELNHQLHVKSVSGEANTFPLTLEKRKYNIQRVTGISKKITQPNPENVKRARLDAKQVRAARKLWSDDTHFNQQFIWPAKGRMSGVYGSQRFYNGKPGRPHYGLDVAAPTGTAVIAPADGVVRLFVPDMFYSGGTLIIDHGMGVSSTFLHLSAGLVKAGDVVKQGQLIAKIGSTGRSTGPHLDWRMNWLNQRVDPQLLVPARK